MRCSALFRTAVVTLSCLILPTFAHAGESTKLDFMAPEDCGSEQDFMSAVAAREGQITESGAAARTLHVKIDHVEGNFVGTLSLVNASETFGPREFQGESCAEVIDALALVAATALKESDEAAIERTKQPEPPTEAPAKEPAKEEARPEQPRSRQFSGRSKWGRDDVAVPAGIVRFNPIFAVNVQETFSYGPIPKTMLYTTNIVFELANTVTTPDGQQRITGPMLRLRYGMSLPEVNYLAGGMKYGIGLQSVAMGICWSPYYNTQGLVLTGCGEVGFQHVGVAAPDELTEESSKDLEQSFILPTLGAVLEARYNLIGKFHVGANLGFQGEMARESVQAFDGTPLFRTLPYAASASLFLGLHF